MMVRYMMPNEYLPRKGLLTWELLLDNLTQTTQSLGREHKFVVTNRAWVLKNAAALCKWDCCGEIGSAPGCKYGEHRQNIPQDEKVDPEKMLIDPAPTRTPVSGSIRNTRTSNTPAKSSVELAEQSPKPTGESEKGLTGQELIRVLSAAEKEQEKSMQDKSQQEKPEQTLAKSLRAAGTGTSTFDTNFEALPDYSPPTDTLVGDPYSIFKIDSSFDPLDLSQDPNRKHLHEAEVVLASRSRLTCASYLCSKRRIFKSFVETLQEGKEYKKLQAQQVCKVDARKSRIIFGAFEQVGWFDRKHFEKHIPAAQLAPGDLSDSDTLSSVDEKELEGPPPDASEPLSQDSLIAGDNNADGMLATTTPHKPRRISKSTRSSARKSKTPARKRNSQDHGSSSNQFTPISRPLPTTTTTTTTTTHPPASAAEPEREQQQQARPKPSNGARTRAAGRSRCPCVRTRGPGRKRTRSTGSWCG